MTKGLSFIVWIAAAAVAAYACQLVVHQPTPIDAALPFLALCTTLLALISYPAVMLAVPLLIATEIAAGDESVRLLLFGAILAAAWTAAVCSSSRKTEADRVAGRRHRAGDERAPLFTIVALVLTRWIPMPHDWGREVWLLLIAAAIVMALRRTPFAMAVAFVAVFATPAVPLRTLVLPLAILGAAVVAFIAGAPRIRLALPSILTVAFVLLFFAWSGVVARGLKYFFTPATPRGERLQLDYALRPGHSDSFDVPPGATSLIVSGANMPRLGRGTFLGTIDPGGIPITIGDVADWGFMRREAFYGAHNPVPADPAGHIRGYGYLAWLEGAGRIPLPRGASAITIHAEDDLPANAVLQIEAFEKGRPR